MHYTTIKITTLDFSVEILNATLTTTKYSLSTESLSITSMMTLHLTQ